MAHTPVLLNEAISFLKPENGRAFIDATAGGGGHAKEILKKMGKNAILVAVDRDKKAIEVLKKKFSGDARLKPAVGNFRNLKNLAGKSSRNYDGIIFDLGMSSVQLEESGRGFSFQKDEPLLMTYEADGKEGRMTAAEIVNTWPEKKITEILRKYGEEHFARSIAKAIVRERKKYRITSSKHLAELVAKAVPQKNGRIKINPATKTFQALRIAVNDELGALENGLSKAFDLLKIGGRLVVISFHSLEDRIVKNFLKNKKKSGEAEILTKKPAIPSFDEVRENPRARSAKMRVAVKIF